MMCFIFLIILVICLEHVFSYRTGGLLKVCGYLKLSSKQGKWQRDATCIYSEALIINKNLISTSSEVRAMQEEETQHAAIRFTPLIRFPFFMPKKCTKTIAPSRLALIFQHQ